MLLEANQKLEAEMEQGKKYVKVIGQYLLDHLKKNPADAAAIMTEGKTIKGSIDAMRQEATKEENGGMLSDPEGYAVVLHYFGIDGQAKKPIGIKTEDLF
ncbi:MAG: hypothetical protein JWM44_2490 [Bacilli bacterium]|nr:hypothetical protein [Bacilli bacterium]